VQGDDEPRREQERREAEEASEAPRGEEEAGPPRRPRPEEPAADRRSDDRPGDDCPGPGAGIRERDPAEGRRRRRDDRDDGLLPELDRPREERDLCRRGGIEERGPTESRDQLSHLRLAEEPGNRSRSGDSKQCEDGACREARPERRRPVVLVDLVELHECGREREIGERRRDSPDGRGHRGDAELVRCQRAGDQQERQEADRQTRGDANEAPADAAAGSLRERGHCSLFPRQRLVPWPRARPSGPNRPKA
jgi:hypothetical protein